MIPGFDVETSNVLGRLIGQFERFHLEGSTPQEFDPQDLFVGSEQVFFRIRGLASFWQSSIRHPGATNPHVNFGQYMSDLVIAAHNQPQADLTLLILGTPHKTTVYLSLGSEQATRTILEGIFPGIQMERFSAKEINDMLPAHFRHKGIITGIPSNKSFGTGTEIQRAAYAQQAGNAPFNLDQIQLERVVRGMHSATWAYVVQAHPRPRLKVIEARMRIIDLLTQVYQKLRAQWTTMKQDNEQLTSSESGGSSQTYSGDMLNYRSQYLIRLLEHDLERHDQAMAAGQWTVKAYFGASELHDAQRLGSLLLGILAGTDSRPEPLRATICHPNGISLKDFHTYLNSHEVGMLIRLPREEVQGYAIYDHVNFDVDFPSTDQAELPLGHIQQNGKNTPETYNISLEHLTKHAVVIGVTGSGKTTTVMNLLDRVVEADKPFLVIEPAKTEYRSLHRIISQKTPLRIYTLGNEMIAPFRLNPFEFETDDEPGSVSLLSHIDSLKAVFNAAFPLYAPMPQVLETALHEIYEDKGWDLTSGINHRLTDWSQRHEYPIFPTMTDLYYKVEEVTVRLGYHHEIESNVKAALKSRIGSLRIGSKGLMLDTARGISMHDLLNTPTILELESIGNDDEKTFLMGLFLTRLYEFRRLQAATGLLPSGFQHLLVFEEAHRLLKNTSTQVNDESSNPRAQAIETFTNMLSEVRAYGQGVLVAEQIPSKLAPDVLKNTNLKIAHRLIASDDRQSIGQTMSLSEEQQNHLSKLVPGMAAVYAEGNDHAYLVRIDNYKRNISPLLDRDLKRLSQEYASVQPYQAILNIDEYELPMSSTGGPDPTIYQAAGKLLDSEKSRWLWSNIILRIVVSPANTFDILLRFSEQVEEDMSFLLPEQHNTVLQMVLVRGSFELMQQRGAQSGWTYEQTEELSRLLTLGLSKFMRTYAVAREAAAELDPEEIEAQFRDGMIQAGQHLEQFASRYKLLMKRRQGPFAGCSYCPACCLYRSEVRTLLSQKNRTWISDELSSSAYATEEERYQAVAEATMHIVRNWSGKDIEETADPNAQMPEVAFCAALHTVATPDYTEYEQAILGINFKEHFFTQEEEEELWAEETFPLSD
jgi:DNA helicase HerA-like ATPase